MIYFNFVLFFSVQRYKRLLNQQIFQKEISLPQYKSYLRVFDTYETIVILK